MTPAKLVSSLPESIRVGAFDIALKAVDATDASVMEAHGYFDAGPSIIGIRTNHPSPPRVADTLLHETLHAIWWTAGLKDSDDEERVVSALGVGLTQVLRDNPWLLKWLAKALA